MKILWFVTVALILAAPTVGNDLGMQAPQKSPPAALPCVPAATRQGGDTIEMAYPIPSLPFVDTGTTIGYTDDYDESCPILSHVAPDVVYRFDSTQAQNIDVDLCGSDFDTRVYIYDTAFQVIACNDDFYFGEPCGSYTSKIEHAHLEVGAYFIVIDGYGAAAGPYVMTVEARIDCVLACPAGGVAEGEPPLVDGYVDHHNGGCNTPGSPIQELSGNATGDLVLCGVGGWYRSQGVDHRDTDWYALVMGADGAIEIRIDAEMATYVRELLPQDCETVGVAQQATAECEPVDMIITGYEPGAAVWVWVGSTAYFPPSWSEGDYDYVLRFSGLEPSVATEATTWSTVKALYN